MSWRRCSGCVHWVLCRAPVHLQLFSLKHGQDLEHSFGRRTQQDLTHSEFTDGADRRHWCATTALFGHRWLKFPPEAGARVPEFERATGRGERKQTETGKRETIRSFSPVWCVPSSTSIRRIQARNSILCVRCRASSGVTFCELPTLSRYQATPTPARATRHVGRQRQLLWTKFRTWAARAHLFPSVAHSSSVGGVACCVCVAVASALLNSGAAGQGSSQLSTVRVKIHSKSCQNISHSTSQHPSGA